jgi:hypothetical protein
MIITLEQAKVPHIDQLLDIDFHVTSLTIDYVTQKANLSYSVCLKGTTNMLSNGIYPVDFDNLPPAFLQVNEGTIRAMVQNYYGKN